jgi:hypothetical protein
MRDAVPLAIEIGEVPNEAWPTREPVLTREHELRISETNVFRPRDVEPWVTHADAREGIGVAGANPAKQRFSLFFARTRGSAWTAAGATRTYDLLS